MPMPSLLVHLFICFKSPLKQKFSLIGNMHFGMALLNVDKSKKTVMVYSQGQENPEMFKSYFDSNAQILSFDNGLDIIDTIVYAGAGGTGE